MKKSKTRVAHLQPTILHETSTASRLQKECDFNLLTEKGVGDSLRQEAFDFFVAAHTHDLTPRSRELIVKGAVRYKRNLKLPSW